LSDVYMAVLVLDAPRDADAKPVHIERQRGVDVRDVEDRASKPRGHAPMLLRKIQHAGTTHGKCGRRA